MSHRVLIGGAKGRMGERLCALIGEASDLELAAALEARMRADPVVSPRSMIVASPSPIRASTCACSITLITMKRPAKKPMRSQSIPR